VELRKGIRAVRAWPFKGMSYVRTRYKIETERETEVRWIAEIVDVCGCKASGTTEKEAMATMHKRLHSCARGQNRAIGKKPTETVTGSIEAA